MPQYLYHGTSDIKAKGILQQGLCAQEEKLGTLMAIYATTNPWIAEVYGGAPIHQFLQEVLDIREPVRYAQELLKHSKDIYRFQEDSLPPRCRVRPDMAVREAVKITGCRCIPPELLEKCSIPIKEEEDLHSSQSILDYCEKRWDPVKIILEERLK